MTAKSAALAVVILGGRHAAGALGWEGRLHLSSVAPLLTGAFFVTGVLLGGVMTDYKCARRQCAAACAWGRRNVEQCAVSLCVVINYC